MTSTQASATPAQRPILRADELRQIEARHAHIDLMRRAGMAAARFVMARTSVDARIVLFAGPGNNGGDALACATELASAGYAPHVVLLAAPERLPPDAHAAWRRAREISTPGTGGDAMAGRVRITYGLPTAPCAADWVVDGLFGIGLQRPLTGVYAEAVTAIAQARAGGARVLALDVPSGVDADLGSMTSSCCVSADHTLSFIALKPGLLTGAALDHVGELHLDTLELAFTQAPTLTAYGLNDARSNQMPLAATAHKGSRGTLRVIGGAAGMLGAALLASRAAMRSGAGKVHVAWLATPHPQVDPLMPEVMMHATTAREVAADATALVAGCGMGRSAQARRVLAALLEREVPLLLDADALNLIAHSKTLQARVAARSAATVLTPHPAEAARLLAVRTSEVQDDRLRAARELAARFHGIAVLKGAGTIVDDGRSATINTTGNALLATAGTGDVLAGMIGALLAQGYAAATAARIGVALHGAAADALSARGIRHAVASDIIAEIPTL